MPTKFCIAILLISCLCLTSGRALAQQGGGFPNLGNIGPSKGEVVGAIVGAAAVIGLIVYLVVPKHMTIEGCVSSEEDGLRLTTSKGDRTYILQTNKIDLQPGRRVALRGKKAKGKSGAHEFGVRKLVNDEGACTGPSPGPHRGHHE